MQVHQAVKCHVQKTVASDNANKVNCCRWNAALWIEGISCASSSLLHAPINTENKRKSNRQNHPGVSHDAHSQRDTEAEESKHILSIVGVYWDKAKNAHHIVQEFMTFVKEGLTVLTENRRINKK